MSVYYIYGNNIKKQKETLRHNKTLYYFKLESGSFGYIMRTHYCCKLYTGLPYCRDITKNNFIYLNYKNRKKIKFFNNLLMLYYIESWIGPFLFTNRTITIKRLKTVYKKDNLIKRFDDYHEELKAKSAFLC